MTVKKFVKNIKFQLKRIIINNFDNNGNRINQLKKDLEDLTGVKVLGSIPFINDMSADNSPFKFLRKKK